MSTSSRRPTTPVTAALTALALSLSLLPAPAAAAPAGKGSVLTLEGDDPAKGVGLTKALQAEFAARGISGGRDMSLSELKLTMGCDEPPSPRCLADGGKTLGVDTMIYGSLNKSKTGHVVTLNLLETGTANVAKVVTAEYPAGAMDSGNVQATAKDLVTRMLGAEKAAEPEPVPVKPEPEPEPEPEPSGKSSKLVWGKHDDVAGWKKAGLYASAGLAVVSLGAALGLFLSWRKPGGPVYKKMYDLAKATHDDDDNGNNVTYWEGDICKNAVGKSDAVVAQCEKGKTLAGATTGLLVAGGIFAAATVAFTTLMFVHREKSPGMAKLHRRGFNLGAAPTPGGGFVVGGGLRF